MRAATLSGRTLSATAVHGTFDIGLAKMRKLLSVISIFALIALLGCGKSDKKVASTALPTSASSKLISAYDSTSPNSFPAVDTNALHGWLTHDSSSVRLAVRVLMTSDGLQGDSLFRDQYPDNADVIAAQPLADKIEAFGAAFHIWIGPKGWTGHAGAGVDGTTSTYLYPVDGSDSSGPRINYYVIPACVGCILSAAAVYFPDAMKGWDDEFNRDGKIPITVPPRLKVTRLSPTLVLYSLPDVNGLRVGGVAYYNSGGEESDASFLSAQFAMRPQDSTLTTFLLNTFIYREGLK